MDAKHRRLRNKKTKRTPETKFLDSYLTSDLFIDRYERRKASGECVEAHEKLLDKHLENMESVVMAINAVENSDYSIILTDYYIKYMTFAEIAQELNTTEGNIRKKLYRATKCITVPGKEATAYA